ncbi:diaminopimelate decarboxylase [Alicyclobacillus vulcanalis]|uniref:Diaminopimelate decarboxylase n=1 Tax=Alicyclobacillus vulcanalis TaxID=252246 RepID=A0A1N7N340_9BACL|nr:diaminopimelate decarboxylase [Alicyclobacillus vulcanalis]SIS92762.1 diaminopimelate decarboxylase [Alicyclobacillus vulcanalis]
MKSEHLLDARTGVDAHFPRNAEGHLLIGGVSAVHLALQFGTPLIAYDEGLIRDTIRAFHRVFQEERVPYQISYASKAFCTMAICQLVHEEGLGIDVVSGGELYTALAAGVPASKLHLHGNNKTPEELEYAIESGIGAVIVDNFDEIDLLAELTAKAGRPVDVLVRVAPGVEAHTHDYISTGQQDSKFGFDLASHQVQEAFARLKGVETVRVIGIHAHIGSQIFDVNGFQLLAERMAAVYEQGLRDFELPFSVLNLGGGFGIQYTDEEAPPVADLLRGVIRAAKAAFAARGMAVPTLWIEPGRSIVGPAGVTLYRVGTRKIIPGVRNYVAIDGGMTDNPRLALYGAKYHATLANRLPDVPHRPWSVAGKCCESGDMLIWDLPLADPEPGDLLAVFATGAYTYAMASHYNRIPKPAVVFCRDGEAKLVVRRETWADVARLDEPLREPGP